MTFSDDDLRSLDPKKIIKEKENDKFDNFFLSLGVVYNDLKSLFYYYLMIEENFQKIDKGKISAEFGEYAGMKNHLNKLIASTIYEFFILLENNNSLIKSHRFKLIYEKLTKEKKYWDILVSLSKNEKTKDKDPFIMTMLQIRNNSYHYDSKRFRRGFVQHFFKNDKILANEKAYYSIGEAMRDSRFYYCDAAAEGAFGVIIDSNMRRELFFKNLLGAIDIINATILNLLKVYIKNL